MTKIVDIINNQLVVDKQKLEFELEKLINNNTMDTEKRVEKSIETLIKINEVSNAYVTLSSYITTNKQE
tara:strand:+ start:316 stop:522 length:207 start_codon:yes stop_codon:yes gene_type:complete